MSVKHTPKPWEVFDHSIGIGVSTVAGADIAHCAGFDSRRSREEEVANAYLIASAPDLLETLKALYDAYKQLADSGDAGYWSLEGTDIGKQTLAAIAKATGEVK